MAPVICGASYLFSILQHILVDQLNASGLCLGPLVHLALHDWQTLALTLHTHPTPITALTPCAPCYLGPVDASGLGLGGFWIPSTFGHPFHPFVFRHPFPHDIAATLISASNPTGSLTNSDFELAALVAGAAILATHVPLHHATLWCASITPQSSIGATKDQHPPIRPMPSSLGCLPN
jgi:hypothetical protein